MKNKKLIRIIVPLLILLVVAGIWFFKNAERNSEAEAPSGTGDFVLEVTSIDLAAYKAQGLPIMIDFGGTNCNPCKIMAPDLKAVNEEMQGKAVIKYLDAWKYPKEAEGYPVTVVPTQVFINSDGTPFVPSEELSKEIAFTMYSTKDTGEHVFTVHEGIITKAEMLAVLAEMGVAE